MTNSNWNRISYCFGVIAAYCSNFGHFAFLAPFRTLRDKVRCLSWAHWKAHSGLPISVKLFSLGVVAEALRMKIDRKEAILLQRGQFDPKFQIEGDIAHQSFFAWMIRPINALQLCRWQFSHKETLYEYNTIQITICNAPYFARRIRGAGISAPRWKNGQQT